MKWIFIPNYIVKIDNKEVDLQFIHADLMCGFTEFVHPQWLENGIRNCKKVCKEINGSKYKLRKLQNELNEFYQTDYKLVKIIPSETGYYWDYNERTYRYPE